LLGTYGGRSAGIGLCRGRQYARYERREVGDAIGHGTHYHNSNWQYLDVLLELKISIKGYKYLTDRRGAAQKLAILDTRPAERMYVRYLVSN